MTRICRHQLRFVPHAPQWLACDTCHADFPHRNDCPGHNTTRCVLFCMTPEAARQEIAALEVQYALPAARTGDAR
ncbi:hypothetical protein [Streptomyces gardneri]|uniref:hypothetical protein n=1 Tax=Streptomyces gardneri TaxID=66892 RepID=UPI0035DE2C95